MLERPPSKEVHSLLAASGYSLLVRLMLKSWRKRSKENARFHKIVDRFTQRHGTRAGRRAIHIWKSHTKAMHALQRRSWLIGQKVERRDVAAAFQYLWSIVLRRRQNSAMILRSSHLRYTRILGSALNLWCDATKEEREERTRQEARSARQQISDTRRFLEGAAQEMTGLRGSLRRLESELRLNKVGSAFAAILCSVRWSRWREATGSRLSQEKSRALVAKCFNRMVMWDIQQVGLHLCLRVARNQKMRRLKQNAFTAFAVALDLALAIQQTVDVHQSKACNYIQKKQRIGVLASSLRHIYQITRVNNARKFHLSSWLANVKKRQLSSAMMSWIRTVERLRAQSMQEEIDCMNTELEGAKDMLSSTSEEYFSLKSTLNQIDNRQGFLDIKLSRAHSRIFAERCKRVLDQTFQWWAYAVRYKFLLLYSCSILTKFQDRRSCTKTFKAWRKHMDTKRQDFQISQRCDIMFDIKVKTRAMDEWVAVVRLKHKEQMRMTVNDANERLEQARQRLIVRVIRRWQNQILIKSLELWYIHISEQKHLKARLLKIVLRLKNAIVTRACLAWRHRTQDAASQRMLMCRILRRLADGVVFATFAYWIEIINERKEFRARMAKQQLVTRRILKRMLNRSSSKAFERWCEQVQEERQLKSRAIKIVLRLMQANVALAFDQWQHWATELKVLKTKATKGVKRLVNRSVSAAFITWLECVESESKKRHLMTRVVTRVQNLIIASTLNRWAFNVRESFRFGQILSKTSTRMRNMCAVRAFARWKANWEKRRQMFLAAGRVVRRWTRQAAAGAFCRWVETAYQRKRLHVPSTKVVHTGWTKTGPIAKAFGTWKVSCEERQRKQRVMARIFARMRNRELQLLASAWASWSDRKRMLRSSRRVMEKVVLWMQTASAARAWRAWRDRVENECRKRELMSKVISRMRNALVASAMDRWWTMAKEQRRMFLAAGRVVRRWTRQAAAGVFCRWVESAHHKKRLHVVSTKIVQRTKAGPIAKVLGTWKANCEERLHKRSVMVRIVARMRDGELQLLSSALASWNDRMRMLQSSRRENAFGTWKAHCEEWQSKRRVMVRIVARMRNRELQLLSSALTLWNDRMRVLQSSRRVMERVVLRMQTASALRAFCRWVESAHQRKRLRALQRFTHLAQAAALDQWHCKVKVFAYQRSVLDKVLRRTIFRGMAAAFARWLEHVKSLQHQATGLARVLFRMENASVCSAFMHWHWQTKLFTHQCSVLKKVILRIQHGAMAASMDRWHDQVKTLTRQRNVLERVLLRMKNRGMSSAFDRWSSQVQFFTRQRDLLERVLLRMKNRAMTGAFGRWTSQVELFSRQRMILERVLLRMKNAAIAGALDRWKARVKEEKDMSFKGSKVVLRWMKMRMYIFFWCCLYVSFVLRVHADLCYV
jgi:hypothetical protein